MEDAYRWMPAAMFDMAAICRKDGMVEACNLLTESAILLHLCLAQKHGQTPTQVSRWDAVFEEVEMAQPQDAIAPPDQTSARRTADVCVLRPRIATQQDSRMSS